MYESLIGNWGDGSQFYDQRKKYMLERVDNAYNDRTINSKIGSSLTENTSKNDSAKLRDDKPKAGQAVSLLRDSNTVSDELVNAIEAVAKQDTPNTKSIFNKPPADAKGLTNVRSILGRSDGTSPNIDIVYDDVFDAEGNQVFDQKWDREKGVVSTPQKVAREVYNFALSEAEKANLKNSSVQSLLDKFFEVDTSKY